MKKGTFNVRVTVEVTDGKATRTQIEEALWNELDLDIETEEGAVLTLVVLAVNQTA